MFKKLSNQFIKFCVVGLLSTIVSYLSFYISLEFFKINYLISSTIGFICGVFIGYPLNKAWTFSAKTHKHDRVIFYFVVYVCSLLLSLAFLKICVEYVGIDPRIAYVLSIGLTTCTNFLGTRFFVFKHA